VFSRGAADQTHVAHRLFIFAGTESTGGRDLAQVVAIRKVYPEGFPADKRMGKIYGVRDRIGIRRIHCDEFISFPEFQFATNTEVGSWTALFSYSRLTDRFNERSCAAVEDRQFKVIQFDDRIINPATDKSGKNVLGG